MQRTERRSARCLAAGLLLLSCLLAMPVRADAAGQAPTIDQLQAHLDGAAPLAADRLLALANRLSSDGQQLASSADSLRRAFRAVDAYETKVGPLFINAATHDGFARKPAGGLELHQAMFALQQALIDHAYTPRNLATFREVLDGVGFRTAAYFPGPVSAKPDPNQVYRVTVNASQPAAWGSPVMFDEDPARRPTGCYLAPGSIATVTVPPALAGKGFAVRVGAHSWDLKEKPLVTRLDRVSLVYPIEAVDTLIANPLGGNIYIEVPCRADAGLVEVAIRNVVRSPFFSARGFAKTTLADWRDTERHCPGPWADFESDKFMMQVPTKWIYA